VALKYALLSLEFYGTLPNSNLKDLAVSSKKGVYDTIDFFSSVIVRMCLKTLICELMTVYPNAEMSLPNSLV